MAEKEPLTAAAEAEKNNRAEVEATATAAEAETGKAAGYLKAEAVVWKWTRLDLSTAPSGRHRVCSLSLPADYLLRKPCIAYSSSFLTTVQLNSPRLSSRST